MEVLLRFTPSIVASELAGHRSAAAGQFSLILIEVKRLAQGGSVLTNIPVRIARNAVVGHLQIIFNIIIGNAMNTDVFNTMPLQKCRNSIPFGWRFPVAIAGLPTFYPRVALIYATD
ncbi:MAG: hypothetical protein IPJ13_25960 [Saprospiraceae bacterium]|nr:hypothetical protein [Saprospiraceae bacterium]